MAQWAFSDVIKFTNLRWGDGPGLSGSPRSNHSVSFLAVVQREVRQNSWKDLTWGLNPQLLAFLKEEDERWSRWIQLWYIVRTFVNVTMYPQYNNNLKKKSWKVLGRAVHVCNPTLRRKEDCKFENSLGYGVRTYLKS
jgi:hypothetical protein